MRRFLIPIVFLLAAILSYFFFTNTDPKVDIQNLQKTTQSLFGKTESSQVNWQFNMDEGGWKSSDNPPACPQPLIFDSPVDMDLVSGILYPGQIRGSDYKPHGGFRFDNRDTNDIEVRAIMDGYVLKASKYDNDGETQILIFLVNDCGIMVMHDHLLSLSPKLQEVLKDVPLGKNGDSRTTNIEPRVYFEKGEVLATEIGYRNFPGGYRGKNIFVDFGLYDLRKTNGIDYDESFRSQHPNINEYGAHALCWFDNLTQEDEKIVKSLPAGGNEGKVSDYCN